MLSFTVLPFTCVQPQILVTVLKVHMHCEACAQEIKRRIQRMKGRFMDFVVSDFIFSLSCNSRSVVGLLI